MQFYNSEQLNHQRNFRCSVEAMFYLDIFEIYNTLLLIYWDFNIDFF